MSARQTAVMLSGVLVAATALADVVQFSIGRKTPVLDGVVSEGEYGAFVPYMYEEDIIAYGSNEKLPYASRSPKSYFAWDDECVYAAMVSEGVRLKTTVTDRDGAVYNDDSVDLLLSGNWSKDPLHHFIFNSVGTMYDAKDRDRTWNAEGVRVKNAVRDGLWTIEIAVPWKTLGLTPEKAVFAPHVNLMRTYLSGQGSSVKWIDREERSCVALGHGTLFCRETQPLVFLVEETNIPEFPELVPPRHGENARVQTVSLRGKKKGHPLFWGSYPLVSKDPMVFRAVSTDVAKKEILFRTENNFSLSEDYRIELDFRDYETDSKSALKLTLPAAKTKGQVDQRADVSALPEGEYRLHYRFVGPDGKAVFEDFTYYGRYPEHPPWENCTAGAEDEVPLPWTKPVFRETSFDCWNRTVAFGGAGLVSSVRSGGRELLSAPVRVLVDGRPVTFRVQRFEPHVSYADYVFAADDGAVKVRVKCRAEFDGYLWFDLVRGEGTLASLSVEIPMRRDGVFGFDDGHSVIEKQALPKGAKGRWTVDPRDNPFLWIGDGKTGMMIGSEDLRGWNVKAPKEAYRIDVNDVTAKVTLSFVDTKTSSDRPAAVGFYLNPTPVRPKNVALQEEDPSRQCRWTGGSISRFFAMYMPGHLLPEKTAVFKRRQANGERVFWYGGSAIASPYSPVWSWFGGEWNFTGDPATVYLECDPKNRAKRDQNGWIWGCLRNKSFFDFKIWSESWMLNTPENGVSNLYFDISFPKQCKNRLHGCSNDFFFRGMREFHKRIYRQLKRKNPDGAMLGHVRFVRTPSDNFFDEAWCGEAYETQVGDQHNYYNLLQPEAMQVHYAARANDMVMGVSVQIYRCYQVYAPQLLASYNPYDPASDRAIRHAAAYFKIHNLLMTVRPDESSVIGSQWWAVESAPLELGIDRAYSAYYMPDCPVTVDIPDRLFLYALFTGRGKGVLMLLNDTDAEVTKTVFADPAKLGLESAVGKDIFGRGTFSLEKGSFPVTLGPRESRFIRFAR